MTTRFVLIGGFLGAGKTTTIARLAAMYQARGQQVAIVTNDKAPELVDTLNLMTRGYPVAELAGTCFCGNVDELAQAIESLRMPAPPDVVLAEPVGSCVDMVATVVLPLIAQRQMSCEVAPYGVLFKPMHGLKILRNEVQGGFSPQAAYLFRKQLEEADFIALNRIDQLSEEQLGEIRELVARDYPTTPLVSISARSGAGFDTLLERLDAPAPTTRRVLEVDYEAYARGEAALGWLNASVIVERTAPFDLDGLLMALAESLREQLEQERAETAHLKILGAWGGHTAVVNLVSNDRPAELSRPAQAVVPMAHLTVNARVLVDPERLTTLLAQSLRQVSQGWHAQAKILHAQGFRPGLPSPTRRLDGFFSTDA